MSVLPFDDRDGFIWFDGKLVPWREAKVHVLTHGLHYGSSVFEGERAYGGVIFKSRQHSERLHKSGELLGFQIPFTVDQLEAAKQEVLKANKFSDAYFRVVAWRGSEMMAVSAQKSTIHVAVTAWEWPSMFNPEIKAKGIRLAWAKYQRPSEKTEPVHSKAVGLYMICTISKHDAEAKGNQDALMLDYRGYLAEATGANLFLVINGELHTPIADCFLNGITRQTVIGLAKENGITVVERHMMPDELSKAQEVFLTGSAAEITPVGEVEGQMFTPGKITHLLMDAYAKATRGSAAAAA